MKVNIGTSSLLLLSTAAQLTSLSATPTNGLHLRSINTIAIPTSDRGGFAPRSGLSDLNSPSDYQYIDAISLDNSVHNKTLNDTEEAASTLNEVHRWLMNMKCSEAIKWYHTNCNQDEVSAVCKDMLKMIADLCREGGPDGRVHQHVRLDVLLKIFIGYASVIAGAIALMIIAIKCQDRGEQTGHSGTRQLTSDEMKSKIEELINVCFDELTDEEMGSSVQTIYLESLNSLMVELSSAQISRFYFMLKMFNKVIVNGADEGDRKKDMIEKMLDFLELYACNERMPNNFKIMLERGVDKLQATIRNQRILSEQELKKVKNQIDSWLFLLNQLENDIPESTLPVSVGDTCPITFCSIGGEESDALTDGVHVTVDNFTHTFSSSALLEWWLSGGTHPETRKNIESHQIRRIPSETIERAISTGLTATLSKESISEG